MKNRTAVFWSGYAAFMVVFSCVFALIWHFWAQAAPNIFYRPWQLSAILVFVFGISFLVGFPRRGKPGGTTLNRYLAGLAVRAAGILATVLPVAYLCLETKGERVALVLCVFGFYILSMGYYLAWVVYMARRDEKPG